MTYNNLLVYNNYTKYLIPERYFFKYIMYFRYIHSSILSYVCFSLYFLLFFLMISCHTYTYVQMVLHIYNEF